MSNLEIEYLRARVKMLESSNTDLIQIVERTLQAIRAKEGVPSVALSNGGSGATPQISQVIP